MSLDGSPCVIRDYLWSKFQQNRVISEGERAHQTARNPHPHQTPPPPPKKRGQISWMLHQTQKDLKIYNLATTNATLMIHEDYVYTSHTIAEDV